MKMNLMVRLMNTLMMATVTSKKAKQVSFDKHDFIAFKSYYYDASIHNKETFTFQGNDYLVDYAKYLIQYLEPQFKEK